MIGAAFGGKLRSLDHYLNAGKPDQSRGGAALLGALRAMKRKGVSMRIERVG